MCALSHPLSWVEASIGLFLWVQINSAGQLTDNRIE
jgi:hypothetical protein